MQRAFLRGALSMELGSHFLSPPPGTVIFVSASVGEGMGNTTASQPSVGGLLGTVTEFGSSSECATVTAKESDPHSWLLSVQSIKETSQKALGNKLYCSNGFSYQDIGKACAGWATTALLPPPRAQL